MSQSRFTFSRYMVKTLWATAFVLGCIVVGLLVTRGGRASFGTVFANQAWAAEQAPAPVAEKSADAMTSASTSIFQSDPLQSLADALKAKEQQLRLREEALKKAELNLEALRKETERNLAQMDAILTAVKKAGAMADEQRQKELKRWVDIYQAMPPEKAGKVFEGLEMEFAVQILSQMDAKKAGKILANVEAARAVELGKRLGKRLEKRQL